jgi:hypothetical protein
MKTIRMLLIGATILGGFLAGGNVDRTFVGMPAWKTVGPQAWADFSRHADLANGLWLYPLEAIGSAVLVFATLIACYRNPSAPRSARRPLYAAALLTLGGLVFTLKAAPIMLGIKDVHDPQALQEAFERFYYWGHWRGVCQILAFFSMLWAMILLSRNQISTS